MSRYLKINCFILRRFKTPRMTQRYDYLSHWLCREVVPANVRRPLHLARAVSNHLIQDLQCGRTPRPYIFGHAERAS